MEEYYKEHILKNNSAKVIHNTIFNNIFVDFFYTKFYKEFLISRPDSPKYLFKLIRPKVIQFETKKNNTLKKFFFQKLLLR